MFGWRMDQGELDAHDAFSVLQEVPRCPHRRVSCRETRTYYQPAADLFSVGQGGQDWRLLYWILVVNHPQSRRGCRGNHRVKTRPFRYVHKSAT